jgi:hypothetical protein
MLLLSRGAAIVISPARSEAQCRERESNRLPSPGGVWVVAQKSRFPHPFSISTSIGATRLTRISKKYKLWKSGL